MTWIRTQDHNVIRRWIIENGGTPVLMDFEEAKADDMGLRIDFPIKRDDLFLSRGRHYKVLSWDEFFKHFDQMKLVFEYINEANVTPDMAYRFMKETITVESQDFEDMADPAEAGTPLAPL